MNKEDDTYATRLSERFQTSLFKIMADHFHAKELSKRLTQAAVKENRHKFQEMVSKEIGGMHMASMLDLWQDVRSNGGDSTPTKCVIFLYKRISKPYTQYTQVEKLKSTCLRP
jgi:hypothetical protein